MLSREENALLTQVGPGTPMGELMRRYWQPALLSRELPEPDCPPVRVRLLGERLVAFRDTQGRIGLIDEFCAHRGVSLFLGRNEDCGLRCVFHGWKYDAEGQCVDQMNEPVPFSSKIRLQAYPTVEVGGLIWTYMGPPAKRPSEPRFEWTQAPDSHRYVSKTWEECNWLQALEGGIDTSHAPILHRLLTDDSKRGGIKPSNPFVRGKAPKLVVDITDYGYQYAGIRPLDGTGDVHIRTYHFVMPFHQIRPSRSESGLELDAGHIWVPIDDDNCVVYNWSYCPDGPLTEEDKLERGLGNGPLHVDQATFRSKANRANDYLIDRTVQRTETFSGIDGINAQDRALQESMGRVVDRSKEHLGPADKAIIQARKLLRQAVKTVEAGGAPDGTGSSYYPLRAHEAVIASAADWRAELVPEMQRETILQTV